MSELKLKTTEEQRAYMRERTTGVSAGYMVVHNGKHWIHVSFPDALDDIDTLLAAVAERDKKIEQQLQVSISQTDLALKREAEIERLRGELEAALKLASEIASDHGEPATVADIDQMLAAEAALAAKEAKP